MVSSNVAKNQTICKRFSDIVFPAGDTKSPSNVPVNIEIAKKLTQCSQIYSQI
jgi:hypothetical protein